MEQLSQERVQDRQAYESPAVVYEASLDVRAGTPINPFGGGFGPDWMGF